MSLLLRGVLGGVVISQVASSIHIPDNFSKCCRRDLRYVANIISFTPSLKFIFRRGSPQELDNVIDIKTGL